MSPPHPLGPLAPLAEYRQFIVFQLVPLASGRTNKLPMSANTGEVCDAHSSAAWTDYATAAAAVARWGSQYRVGFTLTEHDPFVVVDLDSCAVAGGWSDLAKTVCGMLPGSVVEKSQSGTGLHVWLRRSAMPPHAKRSADLHIECYSSKQAICLGSEAVGEMAEDCTHVDAVVAMFFQPREAPAVPAQWTTGPVEGWRAPITDEQLKATLNGQVPERITAAQAYYGNGKRRWTLHELWAPDVHAMQAENVRSEARMSLLTRLVFITGGDCQRVADLTATHPLAVKDGRETLHRDEILSAHALFLKWWLPEKARRDAQQAEDRRIGEALCDPVLPTIMTLEEMHASLVYVNRGKIVVHRGTRKALKWDEASGAYAASRYQYTDGGKERDVPALPLWLKHPQRRTVDVLAWNPAAGEFCTPADGIGGSTTAYNTFRGLKPLQAPANWQQWGAPFVQHVAYLVPAEAERTRFLQWLAHIVQRPGELPHTCYLMIAHETGIGRNWLAGVLARVLSGFVAAGVPLADVLDGKFNGYLSEKLLATVDEAREGLSTHRYARGEALKRLITEEHRIINAKYGLQTVEVNCCRWLMFSNHDDALPFDNNDRRVVVIENPSQRQQPEYYAALYAYLGRPEFIASVREYFRTLPLDGFSPGAHAPMNAAKHRVLEVMAPSVDRAIREFVDTWPTAFAGLSDIRRAVQEATGEAPKEPAFSHAVRRAVGLVRVEGRPRVNGVRERPFAVKLPPETIPQIGLDQIAAAIKAGRQQVDA